jgi:hypothetical protein
VEANQTWPDPRRRGVGLGSPGFFSSVFFFISIWCGCYQFHYLHFC